MKPQRIVSLLASATEILYGLGLGEKVVAVSHECDFPPEVASKPRVTYTHIAANASSVEIDRQVTQRTAAGEPIYNVDDERLASLVAGRTELHLVHHVAERDPGFRVGEGERSAGARVAEGARARVRAQHRRQGEAGGLWFDELRAALARTLARARDELDRWAAAERTERCGSSFGGVGPTATATAS